jgi:hypothetical protein
VSALEDLAAEMGVPVEDLRQAPIDLTNPEEAHKPARGKSYLDVLKRNPSWNALQAQIVDETAGMMLRLVTMAPFITNQGQVETHDAFTMRVERLRGEIRGMLAVLEAPAVAARAIEMRREDTR